MNDQRPRRAPFAGSLLFLPGLFFGFAPAAQELDAREHKEIGKLIEKFVDPKTGSEEQLEVKEDLAKALEKIGKKRVEKGEDAVSAALALNADLGRSLQAATSLKSKRGGAVTEQKLEFLGSEFTYSLWVPASYKHAGDPVPLVLCLPGLDDQGQPMSPAQFLSEQWVTSKAREEAMLAVIQMPADTAEWTKQAGVGRLMLTFRDVRDNYLLDYDRVYLLGRGAGVEGAVALGGMYPHLFAGVAGQAGDAGETPPGNFSNLPTFFAGAGGQATAFCATAKELGFDNCTIEADAKDDDLWAWMKEHPRVANPVKVTLVAGRPIPNKAYWVEIPPIASEGDVRVTAEADRAANTVTVTGAGTPTVTLYFNDALLDLDRPIKLVLNGVEQEVVVRRSIDDLMLLIGRGTSDPGKLYVAQGSYDLP